MFDEIFELSNDIWPIVVHPTRYRDEGIEGCSWFAICSDEYPNDAIRGITSEDPMECSAVWADPMTRSVVGMGDDPNAAVINLLTKIVPYTVKHSAPEEVENELNASGDALAMITLEVERVVAEEGNDEDLIKYIINTCDEWKDEENGVRPILVAFVCMCARLIIELAAKSGVSPQECLQEFALSFQKKENV